MHMETYFISRGNIFSFLFKLLLLFQFYFTLIFHIHCLKTFYFTWKFFNNIMFKLLFV